MIIGLFPALLTVGGAVILSSLPLGWTRVVLVGHYQPLALVGRWPPSYSVWPGTGYTGLHMCPVSSESPHPLDGPVNGLARGWLVCDGLGGHHFLITCIYYTVIHGDLDPYCFIRNPCILHLNE